MAGENGFEALIRRVQAGDEAASTELMNKYESAIRRAIRVRFTNPRLRRVVDSVDICQEVFGTFFKHVRDGEFHLETPEQLIKLLVRIAHNKVADIARHERADKRDIDRLEDGGSAVAQVHAEGETPSEQVAGAEILQQYMKRLTPQERYLQEQRDLGREWEDIAAELKESPEALRKRLERAKERVARELGLDRHVP